MHILKILEKIIKIYNSHLDLNTEFILPTHVEKQGKRDINIETEKENLFR